MFGRIGRRASGLVVSTSYTYLERVTDIHNCFTHAVRNMSTSKGLVLSNVRVISFDVTDTLLVYQEPITDTYCNSAKWARMNNFPSPLDLKVGFKVAYRDLSARCPAYGYHQGMSERDWWIELVKLTLKECGCSNYSQQQFDRFFRCVYQHYCSDNGYHKLEDGFELIKWLYSQKKYSLGILTNAPHRTVESVLPSLGFKPYFDWYMSASDVGHQKPSRDIFEAAYEMAEHCVSGLKRCEMLHIGNDFATDYCGARAAGFQAIFVGAY